NRVCHAALASHRRGRCRLLVLAEALTEGGQPVIELIGMGASCIGELYTATNRLLGADYPESLLPADVSHRRGRTLVDQYTAQELIDAARQLARERTPPGFRGIEVAGIFHPPESLNHGIFIQGPTGAGKSSCIDTIRLSIIPIIGQGHGYKTRLVDFDDKG